jgi:hypothetical protein
MKVITGFLNIKEAILNLEIGEVCLLRIDYNRPHMQDKLVPERVCKYRRIIKTSDDHSSWDNRSHSEGMMMDKNKDWYESCFSETYYSLEKNYGRMISHDCSDEFDEEEDTGNTYLMATKAVIYHALDNEIDQAFDEIQVGCYDNEKLELYDCPVYKRKKAQVMTFEPIVASGG